MKLILASASPRRSELLGMTGIPFEVIPSTVDEVTSETDPVRIVSALADAKARDILARHPGCAVLGADTIVVLGGKIFGKPVNRADAVHMLEQLSGKTHSVFTGWTILTGQKEHSGTCESAVTFRVLDRAEIEAYVETGEPFDKAGAYGVQGLGALLIERIQGSYTNIVGIPLAEVFVQLRAAGLWSGRYGS